MGSKNMRNSCVIEEQKRPPHGRHSERAGRAVCRWLAWCESSGEDGWGSPWSGRQLGSSWHGGSLEFVSVRELEVTAQPKANPSCPSTPPLLAAGDQAWPPFSASHSFLIERESHRAEDLSEVKVRYMPGMVSGIKWALSKWSPWSSPSLLKTGGKGFWKKE